jgi:hypothetical protein
MCNRKYLPTLGDLIDRLAICQIKEALIPERKTEYAQEIKDLVHDIDIIIAESNLAISGDLIRAITVIAQYNLHVWVNEANCRKGIGEGNNLELSHTLNGVRNRAKNKIQETIGGRKDYKTDCLAAKYTEMEPSW